MEELVEVFPNEMIAQFWSGVLIEEGIKCIVKPQLGGYGMWGQDAYLPHALYVLPADVARTREVITEEVQEPHASEEGRGSDIESF